MLETATINLVAMINLVIMLETATINLVGGVHFYTLMFKFIGLFLALTQISSGIDGIKPVMTTLFKTRAVESQILQSATNVRSHYLRALMTLGAIERARVRTYFRKGPGPVKLLY